MGGGYLGGFFGRVKAYSQTEDDGDDAYDEEVVGVHAYWVGWDDEGAF